MKKTLKALAFAVALAGAGTASAAVPEAETYALSAAGLGVLGWIGRRRKTQA